MKNTLSLLLLLALIDLLVFLVHYNAPVTKQVTYGKHVVAVQPADLAFGRGQVAQFMHDRRDAGVMLNHNPVLKEQLALLFADNGQGDNGQVEHVRWDDQEPDTGTALHQPADGTSPAVIQVPNRAEDSPTNKCASLIFELHNVRNDQYFKALILMAARNQISREDYVVSMAQAEFEVRKIVKEFLLEYPLSGADVNDHYYKGIMKSSADFSDCLRYWETTNAGRAYLNHYRDQYDQIALPLESSIEGANYLKHSRDQYEYIAPTNSTGPP